MLKVDKLKIRNTRLVKFSLKIKSLGNVEIIVNLIPIYNTNSVYFLNPILVTFHILNSYVLFFFFINNLKLNTSSCEIHLCLRILELQSIFQCVCWPKFQISLSPAWLTFQLSLQGEARREKRGMLAGARPFAKRISRILWRLMHFHRPAGKSL